MQKSAKPTVDLSENMMTCSHRAAFDSCFDLEVLILVVNWVSVFAKPFLSSHCILDFRE